MALPDGVRGQDQAKEQAAYVCSDMLREAKKALERRKVTLTVVAHLLSLADRALVSLYSDEVMRFRVHTLRSRLLRGHSRHPGSTSGSSDQAVKGLRDGTRRPGRDRREGRAELPRRAGRATADRGRPPGQPAVQGDRLRRLRLGAPDGDRPVPRERPEGRSGPGHLAGLRPQVRRRVRPVPRSPGPVLRRCGRRDRERHVLGPGLDDEPAGLPDEREADDRSSRSSARSPRSRSTSSWART